MRWLGGLGFAISRLDFYSP